MIDPDVLRIIPPATDGGQSGSGADKWKITNGRPTIQKGVGGSGGDT